MNVTTDRLRRLARETIERRQDNNGLARAILFLADIADAAWVADMADVSPNLKSDAEALRRLTAALQRAEAAGFRHRDMEEVA